MLTPRTPHQRLPSVQQSVQQSSAFQSQFQTTTHVLLPPNHLCDSLLTSIVTGLIFNSPLCTCVCGHHHIHLDIQLDQGVS